MSRMRLLAALVAWLAIPWAMAQADTARQWSAEDYFNRASRQYVKEDKASAMRMLDKGLRAYPGDPRMLKLAEELLKEDQQQDQQQQQQQQQDQQQQDQQQQDQQQQQQDQGQQEQDQQQQDRSGDDRQEQQRSDQGMSRRDAERLLDELNREEQDVQERARARMMPARKARIEKDW